ETAAMLADERAVDVKIGAVVGTVELDEQLLARQLGRHRVMPAIPADAAIIIIAAVLPIQIIPSVREAHGCPSRIIEGYSLGASDVLANELPGIIQAKDASTEQAAIFELLRSEEHTSELQ